MRRRHRDPIPPELVVEVLELDQGCVAPRLGGSFTDCWGRDTLEHVKPDLRMGVGAEHVRRNLVTLCEGHTEPGRKAGYQWNTDARNRERVREYLAERERRVLAALGLQGALSGPDLRA